MPFDASGRSRLWLFAALVLLAGCEFVAGVTGDPTIVSSGAGSGGTNAGLAGHDGGAGVSGRVDASDGGTEQGGDSWQAGNAQGGAGAQGVGGIGNEPPSCVGLPATCGPQKNESCCARVALPGGTFNRLREPTLPATVSSFVIDKYEVTVGRFRAFAQAPRSAWVPKGGAGKNPNDPSDPGWNAAWSQSLPEAPSIAMRTPCPRPGNWTDAVGSNEELPINCLDWWLAFAFCAWDGGRLPTEAEWNYAALHGSQDDLYPWGNTSPGNNWDLAIWGCQGSCLPTTQPVGSAPGGNAKWPGGEIADLSGNVSEWLRDSIIDDTTLPLPCNDCVYLDNDSDRVIHGGNVESMMGLPIHTRFRSVPANIWSWVGVRCVRNP